MNVRQCLQHSVRPTTSCARQIWPDAVRRLPLHISFIHVAYAVTRPAGMIDCSSLEKGQATTTERDVMGDSGKAVPYG
jgi:hypothetical protein